MKRLVLDVLSVLLPARCLVCEARVHHACICRRCAPKPVSRDHTNCACCDGAAPEKDEHGICDVCRAVPLLFGRIRSAWKYDERARAIITTMKYRPSMKLCRLGGQVLGQYALKGLWKMDWDCITPVPSSPRSMRIRGFNQAQILGEEVRYSLRDVRRIPLRLDVLLYTGRHKPQASLDPAARFSNVRRMFKAGGRLDGKKILLVDDVLTTGATTNAAAKVLLDAGARDVDLLTLARSSTWGESRWRCSADPDCHFSAAAILRETRDRVKAGQENIECG